MNQIINTYTRVRGVFTVRELTSKQFSVLNMISKKLFYDIIQDTGCNMLIRNVNDKEITSEDMYHYINQFTPVVYSIKLSNNTFIVECLDNKAGKTLSNKMNQKMLTSTTSLDISIITVNFINTRLQLSKEVFDWNKKTKVSQYNNESLGNSMSYSSILEYSIECNKNQ